jgi:hypothetical protein
MAGPSWLAATLAAVMILTAAYSASRLAISRLSGRATEVDADVLHAVMGAAMAGMLLPRLNVLPATAWAAVFGAAAVWFGWRAAWARGHSTPGSSPRRFPVPHLIECVAMLYMLVPLHGPRPAHSGMAMAGMSAPAGQAAGFPALAVVLALFMLGYIVWTTDRLTTLTRAKTTAADPGTSPGHQRAAAAPAAASPRNAGGANATQGAVSTRHQDQASKPVLAPKLAACGKLAMSITMGYMLILML